MFLGLSSSGMYSRRIKATFRGVSLLVRRLTIISTTLLKGCVTNPTRKFAFDAVPTCDGRDARATRKKRVGISRFVANSLPHANTQTLDQNRRFVVNIQRNVFKISTRRQIFAHYSFARTLTYSTVPVAQSQQSLLAFSNAFTAAPTLPAVTAARISAACASGLSDGTLRASR